MRTLVSGAELARLLGVSRQAVHAARKAGRLTPAGGDERGWPLFDIDVARCCFVPDVAQTLRPDVMSGGRPSKKAVRGEIEVDVIAAAATEARQWLATASPAEIEARCAAILERMSTLTARHRRYRDSAGSWPLGWPSWLEFSKLEIVLLEIGGTRTDEVPDG